MTGIIGAITKENDVQAIIKRGCKVSGYEENYYSYENNWGIAFASQRQYRIEQMSSNVQSMCFQGRGVIAFDGVLYNSHELRQELKGLGYGFKSNSDTELLLTCLHHYGIEQAISRFNGMWAFVWHDLENKKIYLCRDRLGVKPLQYMMEENKLYFGSEIKTILEMADKKFDLNEQKIGEYIAQSLQVTNEETFFRGINHFPAGCYAVIDLTKNIIKEFPIKQYWSLKLEEGLIASEEVLIEEIQNLFYDAVNLQLRSDEQVGVLLSGGIDSSAITGVMHKLLGKEVKLNIFSAVSEDKRFDESYFIDSVAEFLGRSVNKVTLDFGPEEAITLLDKVNWHNDEPVGSFSNVAHYLLMKKANELGISVILSGQGADELLCGYRKYVGFYIQSLIKQGKLIKAMRVLWGFKKRGTIVNQFSIQEAKRYLPKQLKPKEINILGKRVIDNYRPVFIGLGIENDVRRRQVLDVQKFSVPVISHFENRMSRAWSCEIRMPFLDHRLVEKFIGLPIDAKLNHGWTKYIFRKSIETILPAEVVWRKDKQGFVNPQSEWLKKELKEKVKEHFSEESMIVKLELINYERLNEKYEKYCTQRAGTGNIWFKDIFSPLALESWLRQYQKYINKYEK
ncbi:asparagine synthetase B [Sporosarcina sp. NCCP-2222]|nr:asparagine synthetase B [Sporosarcina sp. NCCP-2222]